jgi:hypothetical protein
MVSFRRRFFGEIPKYALPVFAKTPRRKSADVKG